MKWVLIAAGLSLVACNANSETGTLGDSHNAQLSKPAHATVSAGRTVANKKYRMVFTVDGSTAAVSQSSSMRVRTGTSELFKGDHE